MYDRERERDHKLVRDAHQFMVYAGTGDGGFESSLYAPAVAARSACDPLHQGTTPRRVD